MIQRMERQFAGRTLSLEIGRMAKLAQGSCLVQYGDTVVLCSGHSSGQANAPPIFSPHESSIVKSRTRRARFPAVSSSAKDARVRKRFSPPARSTGLSGPCFLAGSRNETQIACFILSADQENDADVLALLGASVALNMSKIQFNTTVAGVRVGRIKDTWVLNPTFQQLEYSDVDIVVAGSSQAITMVEGGALRGS